MLYLPLIISISEVLIVTVPVLLTVAFVTIAERKTMASMQRRLGPNAVGYLGLLQALNRQSTRSFHTRNTIYNLTTDQKTEDNNPSHDPLHHAEAIKNLYKDRVAPVKAFNNNLILAICSNFLDLKERSLFLQSWGNKGGIYLIQYKHDPLVYYIGRTNKFQQRFKTHINHKLTDKFHLFARLVGWDNFYVNIIEVCPREGQGVKENTYLQEYLPLLNTTFSSNFSESEIFQL